MTQEEKQLLLIDLCARLPYGVIMVRRFVYTTDANTIESVELLNEDWIREFNLGKSMLKPYLRSISSITEEEWLKLKEWIFIASDTKGKIYFDGLRNISAEDTIKAIDYLTYHLFDYRGLIPMGLALEAPDGMYKTK